MHWLRNVLTFAMVVFAFSALGGCIQELDRPNNLVRTQTHLPTVTPVIIVKYVDRPTMAPTESVKVTSTTVPPSTLKVPPADTTQVPSDLVKPIPPKRLEIIEPKEGSMVRDNVLVVYGRSDPMAQVMVNGVKATMDDQGNFWKGLMLKTGENILDIVMELDGQVEGKATRHVKLLSQQPIFLSVHEPLDQSLALDQVINVSGLTTPDATVKVQGKEVEVKNRQVEDLVIKELGVFSTEINLNVGANTIDVVAENPIGRIIKIDLVVAYLP